MTGACFINPRCILARISLLAFLFLLTFFCLSPFNSQAQTPKHMPDKEEPHLNAGLDPLAKPLDRSTPRQSWSAFLETCRKKQWEVGAHFFNLGDIPQADQKVMGSILARQLCEVLKVTGQGFSVSSLDDNPLGPLVEDKPKNFVVVLKVKGEAGPEEAWLRRIKDQATKQSVWVITRQSISLIPNWYKRLVKKETTGRPAVEVVNQGLAKLPAEMVLSTPRSAVNSFIKLTRAGNFLIAAGLLDLSAIPAEQQGQEGQRLARRLAIVLQRVHPGPFSRMSNDPLGVPERDVPVDEEVVAQASLNHVDTQIRLTRYLIKDAASALWLFNAAAVADIDALYQVYGYGWAGDHLPPFCFEVQVWGIQLWQWLGIVFSLLIAIIFGYIAAFISRKLFLQLAHFTRWRWDDALVQRMRGPLNLALAVLGFYLVLPFLTLGDVPRGFFIGAGKFLVLLALGWFVVRVIDLLADILVLRLKERSDTMGMAMVPVARKMLKPIVGAIFLIIALQNVGMNVGGLLAGLGIGGLAFALAGKNTLENLFGSLIISFDRPFKIGDFIKVGDFSGTVEDVGLRSTRLRTLDRTLVTIPNAQMADSKVENFSFRDRLRIYATFNFQYDTTLDQLRYVVDEIKRYLAAHPHVWQDSFSVRFVGYSNDALTLEVWCYITTADFAEFAGIREAIFMDWGKIIEVAGVQLAYPSLTNYDGKSRVSDGQKAQQAATLVAQRQAERESFASPRYL